MNQSLKFSIIVFLFIGLASCSLGVSDGTKSLEDLDKEFEMKEAKDVEPIAVSIDKLIGTWKYTEVRTQPDKSGTAPVGEVLLGITDKHTLSFATEGFEELKENLIGVPSMFEIKDNKLCPSDMSAEIDFNVSFRSKNVSCYLLNEKEMVLGKGEKDGGKPIIYMYYTRVN